ncbi:MAG: hypothetical protein JWP57_4514 [Spirosoma sp.]|nr:hypothetical protein [Spirosoma sp.]
MSRHSVAADYPSKKRLTEYEAKDLAQRGAELAWYEPWAEHGVLMPAGAKGEPFRCGYVHVGGDANVHLFHDRQGLSRALEALWRDHPEQSNDCELWYFTPDEPIRLRMVVELGDEPDDLEAEVTG